jgi:O-antigen/teichoic acid export membrane protein
VTRTATFNALSAGSAALGGVIIARVLGPSVRGDYAAVTAWFGVLLVVGEVGQSAAICYHVAQHPQQAREYVATSRTIMLITGVAAMVAALAVAPILAHGIPQLRAAYQIAFAGSVFAFVGTSYTFSLQARNIRQWNKVILSQPVLSLAATLVLWRLRLLSLDAVIGTLIATTLVQLCCAYYWCRREGLAPGRAQRALVSPLARYGVIQLAAATPVSLNLFLDRLLLSQLVSPADLGRYAVAASATLVPVPLVSAIGNVAFPRLATQRLVTVGSHRMQRVAVLASAAVATAILLPIALLAPWLIPLVFGPAFRAAVPLLWILTPGGVFLACGQVVGDLLRGRKRPGLVAVSQGLAAIFTVTLLIVLVPWTGVAGAAIASSVAYGVALIAMIRCLWRLPHQECPEPRLPAAAIEAPTAGRHRRQHVRASRFRQTRRSTPPEE